MVVVVVVEVVVVLVHQQRKNQQHQEHQLIAAAATAALATAAALAAAAALGYRPRDASRPPASDALQVLLLQRRTSPGARATLACISGQNDHADVVQSVVQPNNADVWYSYPDTTAQQSPRCCFECRDTSHGTRTKKAAARAGERSLVLQPPSNPHVAAAAQRCIFCGGVQRSH